MVEVVDVTFCHYESNEISIISIAQLAHLGRQCVPNDLSSPGRDPQNLFIDYTNISDHQGAENMRKFYQVSTIPLEAMAGATYTISIV